VPKINPSFFQNPKSAYFFIILQSVQFRQPAKVAFIGKVNKARSVEGVSRKTKLATKPQALEEKKAQGRAKENLWRMNTKGRPAVGGRLATARRGAALRRRPVRLLRCVMGSE